MRKLVDSKFLSLVKSCAQAGYKSGKACGEFARLVHGFAATQKAWAQTPNLYAVFTHRSRLTVHSFYSVFSSVKLQLSPLYTGLTKTTTTYINSNIGI